MDQELNKSGTEKSVMNQIKLSIVKSFLNMLDDDMSSDAFDAEQKESLTVAKQCIEAVYEIEENASLPSINLIEFFIKHNVHNFAKLSASTSQAPDRQGQLKAEEHKCLGNEHMKNQKYSEALVAYSNAIKINPNNAIYYCNRAAAFSRLERHEEAINDCKEAIKLDPNYGKAYGRLGIAYSYLNKFTEATEAYQKAIELDSTNETYKTNLKLAQENVCPYPMPDINISGFVNNPAIVDMANLMFSDPTFRNIVSSFVAPTASTSPSVESFVNVGRQLAEHMRATNPELMENIRQTLGPQLMSDQDNANIDVTMNADLPPRRDPNNDQNNPDSAK